MERWVKAYHSIRHRCKDKNTCYAKAGIITSLTKDNLKYLWERDRADLMVKPSIDRIDTYGDYTLENCRYIELKDNLKRSKRFTHRDRLKGKWATNWEKCLTCETTELKHMAFGLCASCYWKRKGKIYYRNNKEKWINYK